MFTKRKKYVIISKIHIQEKTMKKFLYFWFNADASTQLLHKIALGIGAVCLIVSFLAVNAPINGNFFDIPVFEMFMSEEEYEDFTDDYDDMMDHLDDATREEKREIEDRTGMDYDDFVEYMEDLSLRKMIKLVDALSDVEGFETDQESLEIVNIVMTVIYIYGGIILLFTLLSVLNGSGAGAITIYIIALPFFILLSGTAFVVLGAILYFGFAVVQIKINKEYRAYKRAMRGF